MGEKMEVFDRIAVRRHRERAAAGLDEHDFLIREVGERLADRLDDVKRRFPVALDLGCHGGQLGGLLGDRGDIETLIQCDLSPEMARTAEAARHGKSGASLSLAASEEALPFADGCFDLVLSCLSLHWVNDLPGALIQVRRALKPDGLFLGALFGGETLRELRQALTQSEAAEEGGASPRVSPFADVRDAGDLLGRAGFTLPVADVDTVTVSYENPLNLMADLRAMGESNAVVERRKSITRRATLFAAAAHYRDLYGDDDGRVPATFQVVFLAAWAPDGSQQKPLRPGSARSRLADALDSEEIPAGDKARPR